MSEGRGTRWLDADQQASWRAFVVGITLLLDRLDADLQHDFDLSLTEYEILVRLSERPERQMRMAQLADALAHSRSRVTHTVTRMQKAGLVTPLRRPPRTAAASSAASPTQGYALLVEAAHVHVNGVRDYLVDLVSPEDFAALGRVMDAVSDGLIACHPEMDIRPGS